MAIYVGGFLIFLHDLFTAIWIGGLIFITMTILPVLKKTFGHSPETEKVMDAIMQKHSKLVLISIIGLFVTGLLLSKKSPEFSGLFSFADLYNSLLSIKHITVILMVVITLIRLFAYKSLAAATEKAKKKISLGLLMVNSLFGVIVLLLSGLMANL